MISTLFIVFYFHDKWFIKKVPFINLYQLHTMLSPCKNFLGLLITVVLSIQPVYAQFQSPNDVDTTPAANSGSYSTEYGPTFRSTLIRSIMPYLTHPDFQNAIWGIHVLDLNTGASLFSRNAKSSMIPASNTKLYTTSAALELLGTDFRYETHVWTNGTIENGTLKGDIIVQGSGDPTISGRYNDGDRTKTFRDWAADLKAKGITRIEGNFIGDDTIFDDIALGSSWSWDYTTYWYAAEIGGLSFNENCIDIEMTGTTPGKVGEIEIFPATNYAQLINETVTIVQGEETSTGYNRPWGTNTIYVKNKLRQGQTTSYSLAVTNTALFFVHVMREVFESEGITVEGNLYDRNGLTSVGNYQKNGTILTTYTSPSLEEIVYILNKRSQNLFAENLLKTLGVKYKTDNNLVGDDSVFASANDGHKATWPVFGAVGLDTLQLNLADGSGMSRMNLVTPEMTTALLKYMWNHPDQKIRNAFINSLPRGGEEIGTLRNMFQTGPAKATLAAKTGTLGYARALSGYVTAADGTPLAFSIMVNHHTKGGNQTNRIITDVVNTLAEFKYE